MEHKPLVERLWGIVRTHSFAVFESSLREACPDGSLQALVGALRHLADADQHGLAQELLGESLKNHVASPQILWRLELVLLLGQTGAGGAAGGEDLAAFKKRVKELVLAERLDDAIALVSVAAGTGASPTLYELLGRLHLSRAAADGTDAPAAVVAAPAPKAVVAPAAKPVAVPLEEAVAEAKEVVAPAPARALPAQAAPMAEAPRAAAAPVEPARPAAPAAAPAVAVASPAVSRPAIQPPAPKPAADSAEKPTGERSAPASWVAEELLKARARAQEAKLKNSGEPAPTPAPARAEAVARAVPPVAAVAAEAKPQPAPVELPGADEPKEQVFARLREAFAKLGKIERKVLAWVMANPNQKAEQIARGTDLGSAEIANALKGLTGLWLDPFTFAGYTVRDYVMECMSMGKQAPTAARPSAAAASARATAPSPVRSIEPPRPASPAPRAAEPAPVAARPARAAGVAPAVVSLPAGMSGLDLRVLQYIDEHPGCSPDEVMDAMGPDEPASVSLVTLRREWLDRDAEGRYRIKPDMRVRIPGNGQPVAEVVEAEEKVRAVAAEPAPSRPSELERSSLLAYAPSAAKPASKEAAKLAKLPKGQRQILEFLRDNGKARSKDIANALDQEVAQVNAALLGALADYVSVMHSFWRLSDEAAAALAPAETAEAS